MKKFFLLSLVVIVFFMLLQCSSYESSDPVKKFFVKTAQDLAKKNNLEFCGIGGGTTKEGSSLIKIMFNYNGTPLDTTKGRKLILSISEEFLKRINDDEETRPYLKDYPFTPRNIHIAIYIQDFQGNEVFDPYLNILSTSNGEVRYYTEDPDNQYRFKSKTYEPYAEALEKVKADKN